MSLGMRARDLHQPLGDAGELLLAAGLQLRRAGGEQHLGLEDEAVADDLDVALAGQGLAQLAEELRTIARQLLDLAGERPVELLAEIDDLGVLFLGLGVGGVERGVEPRQLVLEPGQLGGEPHDGRLLLGRELFLLGEVAEQLALLVVRGGERGGEARELDPLTFDLLLQVGRLGFRFLGRALQCRRELVAFGDHRGQALGELVALDLERIG